MWRYFIELLGKNEGDYVEAEQINGGLPLCADLNVAKDFETPQELLEWVDENTTLTKEEYSIRGYFFQNYERTGCW